MQRMQETGRLNAGEERLRNLLIRGLAGDEPAYHAFLQELGALAAPVLGFWYLLGMLIPTAAGALLGSRLLRW